MQYLILMFSIMDTMTLIFTLKMIYYEEISLFWLDKSNFKSLVSWSGYCVLCSSLLSWDFRILGISRAPPP
jgi:hypothetical protein